MSNNLEFASHTYPVNTHTIRKNRFSSRVWIITRFELGLLGNTEDLFHLCLFTALNIHINTYLSLESMKKEHDAVLHRIFVCKLQFIHATIYPIHNSLRVTILGSQIIVEKKFEPKKKRCHIFSFFFLINSNILFDQQKKYLFHFLNNQK